MPAEFSIDYDPIKSVLTKVYWGQAPIKGEGGWKEVLTRSNQAERSILEEAKRKLLELRKKQEEQSAGDEQTADDEQTLLESAIVQVIIKSGTAITMGMIGGGTDRGDRELMGEFNSPDRTSRDALPVSVELYIEEPGVQSFIHGLLFLVSKIPSKMPRRYVVKSREEADALITEARGGQTNQLAANQL
jgi:hypothetical protein